MKSDSTCQQRNLVTITALDFTHIVHKSLELQVHSCEFNICCRLLGDHHERSAESGLHQGSVWCDAVCRRLDDHSDQRPSASSHGTQRAVSLCSLHQYTRGHPRPKSQVGPALLYNFGMPYRIIPSTCNQRVGGSLPPSVYAPRQGILFTIVSLDPGVVNGYLVGILFFHTAHRDVQCNVLCAL